MEFRGILLIITALLWTTVCHGQVLIQPESHTVFPNVQGLISTCSGVGDGSLIQFEQPIAGYFSYIYLQPAMQLHPYGIHLSVTSEGDAITWTVNMTDIRDTNEIVFLCHFVVHHSSSSYPSNKAVITIVNETLPAPNVTEYNETYIELIWYPLEHFNVTYYMVNITNTTSGTSQLISTDENVFNINANGPFTVSHPLIIAVEAFTEVGSVVSSSLVTGFPKRLIPVSKNSINVQVLKTQNGSILAVVTFTTPQVFPYQTLHYGITIEDLSSSGETYYWHTTRPLLNINGILTENRAYRLDIVIWEKYREDRILNTSTAFRTNFTSLTVAPSPPSPSPPSLPSSSSSPSSLPTVLITTTTIAGNSGALITSTPYIAAGGSAVVVIVLVLAIIIVMTIVLLRLKKIKRNRESSHVHEEKGTAPPPSLPPPRKISIMATNPMYEATTPVYESLPHDFKSLSDSKLPHPVTEYMDIPPHIPPPRKMSLDSPGIKSGAEVILSKVPMATDTTDNGEYMYMKSTQSRYVRSPGMKLKLKDDEGNQLESPSENKEKE